MGNKNTPRAGFALGCLVSVYLVVNFLQRDVDVPDPEFLARDLFFQLDQTVISLPAVALSRASLLPEHHDPLPKYRSNARFGGEPRQFATREYKNVLLALAADEKLPAKVSSRYLRFISYGTYGESAISGGTYPLLTQQWSRIMCNSRSGSASCRIPNLLRIVTEEGFSDIKLMSPAGTDGAPYIDIAENLKLVYQQSKSKLHG